MDEDPECSSAASLSEDIPPGKIVRVRVDLIRCSDSVRVNGEDVNHTRLLAELEEALPPILVHRPTMEVIDGLHRLRAAHLKGVVDIPVKYFEGTPQEALVLAIEKNLAHGLPLTMADRKAAALRLAKLCPEWSDRRIAATSGLSHKTVGAIRRRSSGEIPQTTIRLGRDGRLRRICSGGATGSDVLDSNAGGSCAGELGTGEVSLPGANPQNAAEEELPSGRSPARKCSDRNKLDPSSAIRRLRADPSLRMSEAGRAILRWINATPGTWQECVELADVLPQHCADLVAVVARRNANQWSQLASRMDRQSKSARNRVA